MLQLLLDSEIYLQGLLMLHFDVIMFEFFMFIDTFHALHGSPECCYIKIMSTILEASLLAAFMKLVRD